MADPISDTSRQYYVYKQYIRYGDDSVNDIGDKFEKKLTEKFTIGDLGTIEGNQWEWHDDTKISVKSLFSNMDNRPIKDMQNKNIDRVTLSTSRSPVAYHYLVIEEIT